MLENIQESVTSINIEQYMTNSNMEYLIQSLPVLITILLFILFRKSLASFILRKALFFLKGKLTKTTLLTFSKNVLKPLSLIGYLISTFIANEYFQLSQFGTFADNLQESLLIVIVFWLLHTTIDPFAAKMKTLNKVFSKEMINFFLKAFKILIVFLAAAAVLETWGIKVAPILAGLGLFGVAVALGAQDLFKNLIAGVLVIAEKRFENGEWIKIDGVVEGTVNNIGFRSTKITRFDQAPVFVPNTKLSDNVVTNFSRMPQRRITFKFGVLYSTTVDQLKEITEKVHKFIIEDERFNTDDLTNFVRIESFNDSSIDIMVYCFTEDTKWVNWFKAREDLMCEIKTIVEQIGSDFAFPSTSIYLADEEKEIFENFIKKDTKK